MRKLVGCLGLCFLFVHAGNAYGQSQAFPPSFDEPARTEKKPKPAPARRQVIPRVKESDRLIQQRAFRLAEQRRARIEARKWKGISLLRPTRLATTNGFYYSREYMDGPGWWAWIPREVRVNINTRR